MTFPHQLFAPRANVEKLLVIPREENTLWVFLEWPFWLFWPQYSSSTVQQFYLLKRFMCSVTDVFAKSGPWEVFHLQR